LDESEAPGRPAHLLREHEGDDDVGLGKHIGRAPFVGMHEVAGKGEVRPYPISEARRQGTHERDSQHGEISFPCMLPEAPPAINSL